MRLAAPVVSFTGGTCGVSNIFPFPTIGCFQIEQVGRVSRMKGQLPRGCRDIAVALPVIRTRTPGGKS